MEKISHEIFNIEDVKKMLDSLFSDPQFWWNETYKYNPIKLPFITNMPDENLVSYHERNILKIGKALDIGCGQGRNTLFLSKIGFDVDAIDIAIEAIEIARERANKSNLSVRFEVKSIFEFNGNCQIYDFIYDHGCMHHILPHRREEYIETIYDLLKPEQLYGLVCFGSDASEISTGIAITDWDVYTKKSIIGGICFNEDKLFQLFSPKFTIIELRKMEKHEKYFGLPQLWTALFRKK